MKNTLQALLIDDDPQISELLRVSFETRGFEVHTAADGQEALEIMKFHPMNVICVDLMMPKMNGFTFLKALKGGTEPLNSVVMVVTSYPSALDVISEHQNWVDDVVMKPFSVQKLIDKAFYLLENAESGIH